MTVMNSYPSSTDPTGIFLERVCKSLVSSATTEISKEVWLTYC